MLDSLTDIERARVSDALDEHARRFLAAYPRFRDALDAHRVRADLERRLSDARSTPAPTPHVVVHDLFEPGLYEVLEAAWPPDEIFRRDATGRKLDLVPTHATPVADARNAGYDLLPRPLREVWDFLVFVVNRAIVGPWLATVFAEEIAARLTVLRQAHADGLMPYLTGEREWTARANVGRFMVRGNGYALKPHVDSALYLATALMYFPAPGQDEGYGTVLYAPARQLDLAGVLRSGSTEYFDRWDIECAESVRVPYRRNTLLAFPNTLGAAHGVVAPQHGYRRVYQYHLSLKRDDEKV